MQDALRLYDAIATRVAQPRLSDIEMRLWLVSQGCSTSEASRIMKLLRSLVINDENAPSISCWEWCVGWTWVMHAMEVSYKVGSMYGIFIKSLSQSQVSVMCIGTMSTVCHVVVSACCC